MNAIGLAGRISTALAALGLGAPAADAELVTATYHISASGFLDSSSKPPPAPTSTSVDGIYTFTFDTGASQSGIAPIAVTGLDITNKNGVVIDFDETNSGVDTLANPSLGLVDLTIGGNVNSVAFIVGLSDDFRVRFRISTTDYQVSAILEDFIFVTTVNAAYVAQSTSVTLLQASASYCTAGTSASGCQALLSTSGMASATAPAGCFLSASGVEGAKDGLFFYGTNGRQANPWGNGTSHQCVVPPVTRAGLLPGAGTSGLCDGAFSQDLNALWTAEPQKNPGAGALVQAQLWYRDPLNTSNQTTSLSDAIEFPVAP